MLFFAHHQGAHNPNVGQVRYLSAVLFLAGAFFAFAAITPVQATLVALWEFEDNLLDSTANANDAENIGTNGALVTFVTGITGKAGSFDGEAFLRVTSNSTLDLTSGMTIAAWVHPLDINSASGNVGIVFKASNGNSPDFGPYELLMDSPAQFRTNVDMLDPGSGSASANGTVDFNQWQHVVATYDTTVISLYKNGQLIASTPYTDSIAVSNGNLLIGNRHSGGSRFHGYLDDVQVYDHALTSAEVEELASVPEATPLLAIPLALLLALAFRRFG